MSSNLPSVTSPPWGSTTKRIVTLSVIVILYLVARQVSEGTWASFVLALVLAYLLTPVVTFFEHRLSPIKSYEQRRTLSVVLTWLLVFGLFGLVLGLIVPVTVSQMRAFADELPRLTNSVESSLKATLNKPIHLGRLSFVPWEKLNEAFAKQNGGSGGSLSSTLQDRVLSMANSAPGLVGGAVSFVIDLFFVLVMLFYLMRDGPKFVGYLVGVVPESYQGDVRRMLHELGLIWNAYLRGQFLLCTTVGGLVYIIVLILGVPQPLLIGVVAAFMELIPNLGSGFAWLLAVLFSFTAPSVTIPGLHAGLPFAVLVGVALLGFYQIEGMVLVPRILGHSLDLHPFVVIAAILIGASLAGLLGIVLAAPSAATLRLFARYLRAKLLDEEVFPPLSYSAVRQDGLPYRVMRFFLSKKFPVLPPENPDERQIVRVESVIDTRGRYE